MGGLGFRPWVPADEPFLWEMLFQALHVPEGAAPFPRSVLSEPGIAHYLDEFGSVAGDDAEVCETADGLRVGAAWCRRLTSTDPGYGYVSDDVPELGMAVEAAWRGRGIGRRLMSALFERHPSMSLSVDDDNAGAKSLYTSVGFVAVSAHAGSTTMLWTL